MADVINELNRKPTWAELRLQELEEKGRENWDVDDWDAYNYIMEAKAEDERDAEYLGHFNVLW